MGRGPHKERERSQSLESEGGGGEGKSWREDVFLYCRDTGWTLGGRSPLLPLSLNRDVRLSALGSVSLSDVLHVCSYHFYAGDAESSSLTLIPPESGQYLQLPPLIYFMY